MKNIRATDIYGKEYSIEVKNLSLSIHVYGIAVKDSRILVLPGYDGFGFPGGTLELGETHRETLRREFLEETGLEIEIDQLLGVYDSFFRDEEYDISDQSLLIFCSVKIESGEISDAGFDAAEKKFAKKAVWKTLEELHEMRLAMNIDLKNELLGFVEKLI
ncbi:MAG: NUDIX domain-containing protein [Streptococcaceae bacterium]|jgi:ADP-ribose pyrophosphatase YjhB (NUDIX family)|nr:NUDIX domain-containing protein [Streptococcaceae bacterium]